MKGLECQFLALLLAILQINVSFAQITSTEAGLDTYPYRIAKIVVDHLARVRPTPNPSWS